MARKKPVKKTVSDKMQSGYSYLLIEPVGRNFDPEFKPQLTPWQMLELGVFGGRYLRDCRREFPKAWFKKAKLYASGQPGHDPKINYFGVDASQPLSVWRRQGWINEQHDPRGWFQWYCRYYLGRRLPAEDKRQIGRWKAMARHVAQVKAHCYRGDEKCRKAQRQALLHWAYDSRKL